MAPCDMLVLFSQNHAFPAFQQPYIAGCLRRYPVCTASPAFDAQPADMSFLQLLVIRRHIQITVIEDMIAAERVGHDREMHAVAVFQRQMPAATGAMTVPLSVFTEEGSGLAELGNHHFNPAFCQYFYRNRYVPDNPADLFQRQFWRQRQFTASGMNIDLRTFTIENVE